MADLPELLDKSDSSSSGDEADWVEEDSSSVVCLFCPQTYRTVTDAVSHCSANHNFDLAKLKAQFDMDCYSYIRLVNYIRTHLPDPSVIMNARELLWDSDAFLKPVESEDPWLMYDFDDIVISPVRDPDNSEAADGNVTISELQRRIQILTSELEEKQVQLNILTENMETMRQVTCKLLEGNSEEELSPVTCVKDVKLEDDEGYFSTYSHFSIHYDMLSDRIRTLSYRDALLGNSSALQGKTVLDLGCGTGILSMFAAAAGADAVIAIDQSDIIYHAMDIVRENSLADKIKLVKGRLEDTHLPQEQVDVVVSEWMGYLLFYEGMLDSVIYARDHHLVKGGLLLPNRCSVSLVGIADSARHTNLIGFWKDVYGYRMSCLQHDVVREPMVEVVPKGSIITTNSVLTDLDLYTCSVNSVNFCADFRLDVTADGELTAFVGFFDVFFDLPHAVSFSTGPHSEPTHWKQIVFLLEEPVLFKKGDIISGKFTCRRNEKDVRSLSVVISFLGKKLKYFMI